MTAVLTIDLGAIQDNWRLLDGLHDGETSGVVKADAYGLGAERVGPALAAAGCRMFFTAHLAEAVALRTVLPDVRIAVLNGLFTHEAVEFYSFNVVPVLSSLVEIAAWCAAARALGRVLPCFLHMETGMHRLGITEAERAVLAADKSLLDGLRLEYIFTHLVASDDPSDTANARQKRQFEQVAQAFPGVKTSMGNSSGMFLGADFHSDLARPCAALYGVNPTPGRKNPMRHVVTLQAPILQIHDVEPGESVGYSGVWRAERPSRIATLGVGYADGYHRALSNKATAYFDDIPVPLVGRVSMDLTTFDVTAVDAKPGDMLTLLGPRHDADALAVQCGTNGYEILTSLRGRFDRRYIGA